MTQTVSIILCDQDRKRLKCIQRAKIVLDAGERLTVLEVARCVGVSRTPVWRWQLRHAENGRDGLLCDKTRKPGCAPLPQKIAGRVLEQTCTEPPGAATHWTGRAIAEATGISLLAVRRLWENHQRQPHRLQNVRGDGMH